jgi:hypothetical protein
MNMEAQYSGSSAAPASAPASAPPASSAFAKTRKRLREEGGGGAAFIGRPVPAPDLRGAKALRALAAPPAEVLLPLPGGLALTFASRTLQVTQLAPRPSPFASIFAPAGRPGRDVVVAFVGALGAPGGVPLGHQCAVAAAVHPLLGVEGRDLFLIAFTRAAVDAGDLGLAGGVWVTPGAAGGGAPPAKEVPELVRELGDSLRRQRVARTLVLTTEHRGGFRVEAERRDDVVRDLSLLRLMRMLGACAAAPRPPPALGVRALGERHAGAARARARAAAPAPEVEPEPEPAPPSPASPAPPSPAPPAPAPASPEPASPEPAPASSAPAPPAPVSPAPAESAPPTPAAPAPAAPEDEVEPGPGLAGAETAAPGPAAPRPAEPGALGPAVRPAPLAPLSLPPPPEPLAARALRPRLLLPPPLIRLFAAEGARVRAARAAREEAAQHGPWARF